MNSRKATVTVLGSLNVDLIASLLKLPHPGETVASSGITKLFGGKGANQAIAAARQKVAVRFIGCLGDDAEGRNHRQRLKREGIDVRGIATAKDSLTGTALIGVAANGENLIMVASEANGLVIPAWVRRKRRLIETASTLLMQFEIPTAAIVTAIQIANAAKVPTILNPSPYRPDFPWQNVAVHTVIVNESEAADLIGLPAGSLKRQSKRWRQSMAERNIARLVITRGARNTLSLGSSGSVTEVPAQRVKPLDTVGAGDAFAGCFAAGIARGESIDTAINHANCAGALATLKVGAQDAIPTRRQISSYLKRKSQ